MIIIYGYSVICFQISYNAAAGHQSHIYIYIAPIYILPHMHFILATVK